MNSDICVKQDLFQLYHTCSICNIWKLCISVMNEDFSLMNICQTCMLNILNNSSENK